MRLRFLLPVLAALLLPTEALASATFAVTQHVIDVCDSGCGSTTGSENVTTTDLGGETPKAAIFILSPAATNGTAADGAEPCIGFADGTTQRVNCAHMRDNVASAQMGHIGWDSTNNDAGIGTLNPGVSTAQITGEASVSFIANGATLTWNDPPPSPFLLEAIYFAGSDITAEVVEIAGQTQDDTVTNYQNTSLGCDPSIVFMVTHGSPNDQSSNADAKLSFGAADGTRQYGWIWGGDADSSGVHALARLETDSMGGAKGSGQALSWTLEAGNFSGGSPYYTVTARDGNSDVATLMALCGIQAYVGAATPPTDTSATQLIADPSFTPELCIEGTMMLQTADTDDTGEDAGYVGISAFNSTSSGVSYAWGGNDESDNANVEQLADTEAANSATVHLMEDDGADGFQDGFVCSATSMTRCQITCSTADGTQRVWWGAALAATGGGGGGPPMPLIIKNLEVVE